MMIDRSTMNRTSLTKEFFLLQALTYKCVGNRKRHVVTKTPNHNW